MFTKIKIIKVIISFIKRNLLIQKEESDGSCQFSNMSYHLLKSHFILLLSHLFLPLLPRNKTQQNEDFSCNKSSNSNELKAYYKLSSNNNRNRKQYFGVLSRFPNFNDIKLYSSHLIYFLFVYINCLILNAFLFKLNNFYYENFARLSNFFKELILYNLIFILLLNEKSTKELKEMKISEGKEEKRISILPFYKDSTADSYSFCEIALFGPENLTQNTGKFSKDKTIKYDDNSIIIKKINKGIRLSKTKIRHLGLFFEIIKYIILLNLFNNIFVNNKVFLIEYNYYNITLKIKGNGNKNIFFSNSSLFPKSNYPDEVHINGNKQINVSYKYNLNETNNTIGLIWYDLLNSSDYMFRGCSYITEIDLSNFNTSNIEDMEHMFYGCSSLTSLNLSNFDTSKVTYMNRMFYGCSSLTSLNLSTFNTSKVVWMYYMFYNCKSLTSLNLSNFDTSKVTRIHNMFEGCTKLEYINMINFNDNSLINRDGSFYCDMFKNVPDNIVVCIIKDNILNRIYPQLENKSCLIEDCTDDWKLKQRQLNLETIKIFYNYSDNITYEYDGQCYSICSYGYFYDDNNIKCNCELEKCLTCSRVAYNKKLCTKCNDYYYKMENDPLNIGEYFNCYNETPEGYYLDKNNSLFKKCYNACETCEMKGDDNFHNCLKCKTEYNYIFNINNYTNCYQNCKYYYYFDNNNHHCTQNLSCPPKYPYLLQNKNECVIEDIKSLENFIDYIFNYKINNTTEELIKEEEIKTYNKILEKSETIFTSDNYDLTDIDNGVDQVISANKIQITFTNIENQKNNLESNISTIDLGDCEILLRKYYNLTNNHTIYIKKIDIIQEGMKAKKVGYNVYSKLSGKNLEKLNLTVCEKTKIFINIPIEINGNPDKYNTSSGYFKDICYATTSNDGTDITLQDRKNEYIDGDNIICQDDCDFSAYDAKNKKAKCECYAKESNSSFGDMTINKNKIFENLKDIKNLMNINILVCYKKLLSLNSIFNNVGSLIIICIIIFHIISIFIFYLIQIKNIKKMIDEIILSIFNISSINEMEIKENKKFSKRKRRKKRKNKFIKDNLLENLGSNYKNKKQRKLKSNKNISLNNDCINNNNNKTTNNIIDDNDMGNNRECLESNSNKDKNEEKAKKLMKYNTDEMNDLSYELALNYDKRTFCQFYIALLRVKHNLIFSFYNYDDYNSRIIKIDLFFIGFTMDYAVNALFFNDETMHKIYIDKGLFDLETQIPITIYSFLISAILNFPLTLLGLSNDSIIAFKQNLIKIGIKNRGQKLIFCLKLKFALYFFISFILLLFFWYYISMFGIIYKNTQYHLLKDTLISFGISFFQPFIICLLPGLFRIPSLSNPKKKRECLYNFSKIFQLI